MRTRPEGSAQAHSPELLFTNPPISHISRRKRSKWYPNYQARPARMSEQEHTSLTIGRVSWEDAVFRLVESSALLHAPFKQGGIGNGQRTEKDPALESRVFALGIGQSILLKHASSKKEAVEHLQAGLIALALLKFRFELRILTAQLLFPERQRQICHADLSFRV